MTKVAILWHMHQPFYEDLVTHEHILPWVRLHALKDYYGMAALVREFPAVRLTFNLVPSLLVQLEAFAEDRARDRFLDLSLKPAAELTEDDKAFILGNFFHAQRQRMIEPHPRYAELLVRRGEAGAAAPAHEAVRRFTTDDFRDLQVWHKLAWIDPSYLEGDDRVRQLVAKGRHFTEEDKRLLRSVELELLRKVVPEYRAAAERGQVELSTSPFYHPILPLLCDTDIYRRTHPESRMPRRRFVHPEDALEQLRRAAALHERLFGHRPVGLWPSEGGVSDAMAALVVGAGFRWMATDELILARTLGLAFGRDAGGFVDHPERLYAAYSLQAGGGRVACVFRDHLLSDLIGFSYASWDAEAAAEDLVRRLVEAGRRYSLRAGGGEALVSLILDGENAWEHYEGGGRPFLRALYRRLSTTPELKTVTMSEGCQHAAFELATIFPGSWIDANFSIWIGHRDDQRAWEQLADARQMVDEAAGADPTARERAYEEVLIAEGSDWFWWYGDDHSSAHDAVFDELFRRHLRNAYQFLGRPVPDELSVSNISTTSPGEACETAPSAYVRPRIDGEETSYFEWLGAGALDIRETAGAMHRAGSPQRFLKAIAFGFDAEWFYLRLDGVRPMADLLAEGYRVVVAILEPSRLRLVIAAQGSETRAVLERAGATTPAAVSHEAVAAAGTILEAGVRLEAIGATPGAQLWFVVSLRDAAGLEVERCPWARAIAVHVPDERFEARNWSA